MTEESIKVDRGVSARVFVTGGGGLLGSVLLPHFVDRGYHVTAAPGRRTADLTRADDVRRLLDLAQPDFIVNLAALTNVDHCESHPDEAYRTNAELVLHLVRWIEASGSSAHLIQISTDQVYDGAGPHREDTICPINVYAYSKCLAEEYVRRVDGTSLRTNFFGRSHLPGRPSFSDWIVSSLRAGKSIPVFGDVLFSPLSLPTLASSIELVLRKPAAGVFNLGARSGMSKADFAFALATAVGLPTHGLSRATVADVPLKARRPQDMRMDCEQFQAFGARAPELRDEIESVAGEYRDETL